MAENADYVTVARLGEVVEGRGEPFEVAGRPIVLFFHEGNYHAMDDECPHQGAPLSEGILECGVVSCSWHGWRFQLNDGTCVDKRKIRVRTYPVRVVGEEIQVAIE